MQVFSEFFTVWIKFFFILTPFFALSFFLVMTRKMKSAEKARLAFRVTLAVIITCSVLYFFGNYIFSIFGITLDAFRIGAGAILFLSAVDLVRGAKSSLAKDDGGDIAVVPLAIPVIVGPGTTGALLVMGAETTEIHTRLLGCGSLLFAVFCVMILLLLASPIEKLIGQRGLTILSKLTGLVVSAIAAQMIFTGIQNFLK
jgi:multiple antibiotic resistance protein